MPTVPTLPVEPGSLTAHSTVSYPSYPAAPRAGRTGRCWWLAWGRADGIGAATIAAPTRRERPMLATAGYWMGRSSPRNVTVSPGGISTSNVSAE